MSKDVCAEVVYRSVFEEQAKEVRNFLYYKCGNLEQAEDWMQEAFLRLWENCAKVPLEKTKSYLFTIGNRLFLDYVKHQKVKLKFTQIKRSQQTNQSPEFLLEEKEFQARLEAAITALPENIRIVFLMNRIDKLTYKKIAERLGISVKTVEKRMHKALVELRKLSAKI